MKVHANNKSLVGIEPTRLLVIAEAIPQIKSVLQRILNGGDVIVIIDEKGKLFRRISIIDILIVCIILAGIAGAYYKFGRSKTLTSFTKPDRIETVFFAEDVAEYAGSIVKQGDLVKDRITGSIFGKVKEIAIGPNVYYAPNDKGQMVKSSKEGYISLKVVVEGDGIYSDNGITFGGMDYYVNKLLEVRAGNTAIYAKIQSIREIKE